jgi:predicted transcriptional regulator
MQSVQETGEGRHASATVATGARPTIAKNRGRIDVIADVLNCCRSLSTKSHLMLFANVNSIVATRMIAKLSESGLLDSVRTDDSVAYLATSKGVAFVAKYLELQRMISPELVPDTKTCSASRLNGLTF